MLKKLIERRAKVWQEAQDLLQRAEEAERDFDAAEEEQWTKMGDELTKLDERIKELHSLAERNKKADEIRDLYPVEPEGGTTQSGAGGGGSNPAEKDAVKLRSLLAGEVRAVEFTRHAEEKRVLTVGVAAAGGDTVPTGFLNQLQKHMIEVSAIRQTRARVMQTDSGEDIQVPKTTAYSAAVIVAEGGTIPASDPAYGQVTMQAFKYGFLTQLSSELISDTGVDLVGDLALEGGRALGNASGAHFVTGDGSSKPRGVIIAATVGKTGATGVSGAFDADDLLDLKYSVIAPYRRSGEWLFSDQGLLAARKLKDLNDQYLWQPSLQAGVPTTFDGDPIQTDPNVADPALSAKSVAYGDFASYLIRDVASVRIERSDDFAFDTDLATFRFLARTDGDQIDETGAIKVFQGAAT